MFDALPATRPQRVGIGTALFFALALHALGIFAFNLVSLAFLADV